jgi:hypothetical protein
LTLNGDRQNAAATPAPPDRTAAASREKFFIFQTSSQGAGKLKLFPRFAFFPVEWTLFSGREAETRRRHGTEKLHLKRN